MDIALPDIDTIKSSSGRTNILLGNHVPVRGIGDGIILTAVAREVKKALPQFGITMATKGPKVMFENNPYIDEVIDGLIRHGIDIGPGHYIQRKCRYFNIHNPELHGDLFFTEKELRCARETLKLLSGDKPAVIFCQNSTDNRRNWSRDNWNEVIDFYSPWFDFYQVEQKIHYHRFEPDNPDDGMPCVYDTVPAARQELRNLDLRKVMALQAVTKRYLGSNTGFMHIAACFSNDNIVFLHHQYAGDTEWLYPQLHNFYEDAKVVDIIALIGEVWKAQVNGAK